MRFIDTEYCLSDKDFGNDEISKLSNHFAKPLKYAGYNDARVFIEWKKFKNHAVTRFSKTPFDICGALFSITRENNIQIFVFWFL